MLRFLTGVALAVVVLVAACSLVRVADEPTAELSESEVKEAMRRAAEFYRNEVSTEGAYHFVYSEDLSYGRSEAARGLTQATVQRGGTPIVGMAYLEAYAATDDRFFLEVARDAARALVQGQVCSGGWDYIVEFDPEKRRQFSLPSRRQLRRLRGQARR